MKSRRLFSIILVFTMLFSLGLTVSAADTELTINPIKSGDTVISGTGYPDSSLVVSFPDGTNSNPITVDSNGNWSATAPSPLDAGDSVTVTQAVDNLPLTSFADLDSDPPYAAGDIVYLNIGLKNSDYDLTLGGNTTVSVVFPVTMMKFPNGGLVTSDGNPVDPSSYDTFDAIIDILGTTIVYENTSMTFYLTDLSLIKDESTSDVYIRIPVEVLIPLSSDPIGIITITATGQGAATATAVAAGLVTYDANGADSGTVPVDGGGYYAGDTVTVMGNPGNLQKNGSMLVGWTLDAGGNGTVYKENDTFLGDGSDMILYAKWAEVSEPINPSESTNPTEYNIPKTGDYNNMLWASILLFSLGIIVILLYPTIKKKIK